MEMKEFDRTADLMTDKEAGIAILSLEEVENMITAKIVRNIFCRLWFNTDRDGDEFEEIFELVFGQRYEDEDDED